MVTGTESSSELVDGGFKDLHTHILPRVDDGPANIRDVVQMLKVAYEGGSRDLVATPHMFLEPFNLIDPLQVSDRYAQTIGRLKTLVAEPDHDFLMKLNFHLGAENYFSPVFLENLEAGRVLSIGGSQYLLVEFPVTLPFSAILLAVERIRRAQLIPLLAHVERYFEIQSNPSRAAVLIDQGCVIQINASSVMRAGGAQVVRASRRLLKEHRVHLVASDCHGHRRRNPDLAAAFRRLQSDFGTDHAKELLSENPKRILGDLPVSQLGL